MLVAVKIGNSTINLAFFKDPYQSDFRIVSFDTQEVSSWTDNQKLLNCPFLSDNYNFDCIICSVVPEITEKFLDFFTNISHRTIVIDYKTPSGLTLNLNKPESFGVDRLAASVAAYELFKENIAVVDAGTATTITVVTSEKEIVGGAIMPGIGTMNYALNEKTSSLPLIDLNKDVEVLGKDTHSAILSGIVLGTIYAVEGIISEIEKKINRDLIILLTGGYSKLLSKYMHKKHLLNKYLVIEGMRLIYLKNIKN
ncbi:type III pantothenate kinase [Thermodesulfovibrio yellowstonii]|jgi:type III pantothenate kinase|uniref:Type III pantothenate kinase n=1 Tax=Thermodesulfovibrio yellowstonii TaxID=28262 RepID=A0A9W6LJW7_9BACT|nr:type III pantothenate kinase [Thermodesulfovibrio islandicus]GLI52999.1 type III pantothenate kinase [Thermodesulfovibrio islandicus]